MSRVNILVTGTPGTGKTSLAAGLAAATGLRHVDVGVAIKEQELHSGWDEEFQCHIVDEDKASGAATSRLQAALVFLSRLGSRRSATRWRRRWWLAATWWTTTAAAFSPSGAAASKAGGVACLTPRQLV